jgi:iron complex outermembrane receptor protein
MRGPYSWEASASCPATQRAPGYANDTRWSDSLNDTKDASLNFVWSPTSKITMNFDVQSVNAIQKNYDISTEFATYANVALDFSGDHPTMNVDTNHAEGWFLAPGGIANPANYRQHFIMDHLTDSKGHEFATRADLAYSFDSPWLNTLKVGVRYADREQTVRWSTYNWANVVNNWSSYDANNYYITGSKFPSTSAYPMFDFDSKFYGGGVTNVSSTPFFDINLLKDREGLDATFANTAYQPRYTDGTLSNQWVPVCHRSGETDGCFRPAEVADVSEKTKAAYAQFKFGGNNATILNGITVQGNIGVRYVDTLNESSGGVNYGGSAMTYDTTPLVETAPGSGVFRPSVTYYITAADRAFIGTPSATINTARAEHINWLPSFNVRFGLTDKWFLRFAASRAMSRPDIGNLKYYTSVGMTVPSTTSNTLDCNPTTGAFVCNSSNQIVSTKVRYTGQANNPYLKPVTADQMDLAVEDYFASTGSFTFTMFYKKFHDYIQYGKYTSNFTNAGVTRPVEISGPVNGDGASIKGFEAAYQTFFDDLPAPFNGLGIQANFTHLHNTGIQSSNVVVNSGDGSSGQTGGGTAVAAVSFTGLPLEGLSDNTYNIIGMYEKGAWSARVAYNWRSKYLVTSQDCCVAFPIWQKAAGYLDGRIAYRFNDHVEVSVEGTNLLSTETVLLQQVDGPTSTGGTHPQLLLPNAWFKNDRRVSASIRLKY